MYYIVVTTNLTNTTSTYRLSVNYVADNGEEVAVISPNTNYSIILASTGTAAQRKFVLDTKDIFSVIGVISTGQLAIYVGLYPDNPTTTYSWYATGTTTSPAKISVKQTDQNFHLGAYYYVTVYAVNARTVLNLSVN